jgi:hypothetical protein
MSVPHCRVEVSFGLNMSVIVSIGRGSADDHDWFCFSPVAAKQFAEQLREMADRFIRISEETNQRE